MNAPRGTQHTTISNGFYPRNKAKGEQQMYQQRQFYLIQYRSIRKTIRSLLVLLLLLGYLGLWIIVPNTSQATQPVRPTSQEPNLTTTNALQIMPAHFLREQNTTLSVAWGDVDNDGDLDLATGNEEEPLLLYKNENGILQEDPDWRSITNHRAYSIAWGDVNGDGYLDLAVGDFGQPLFVYLNTNGELNQSPWRSNDTGYVRSVAWGDLDGDSDLDMAVGISSTVKIYLNQGIELQPNPILTLGTLAPRSHTGIAWGDADNDGDLDLAVGATGSNTVYFNENGLLTENNAWRYDEPLNTRAIAWGDVDGDGYLDLALGNYNGRAKLYRNNRQRAFITDHWRSVDTGRTLTIALGDVDGNGYLDLTTGSAFGKAPNIQPIRIYRNIGGALERNSIWSAPDVENTRALAWGDMDGDGDLDLAAGRRGPDTVYQNRNSTIRPTIAQFSPEADSTNNVAWGDVDNDGDLDLAVGNTLQQQNLLYRNDNLGTFTPIWRSESGYSTHSIAWGDVDGDGDLDLAVGNSGPRVAEGEINELFLNNNGVLDPTAAWTSRDVRSTRDVAWGDVDNDGDLDLAAATDGGPNRIYLNNEGELTLRAVWDSDDRDRTLDVAWGDVDHDGDLDLAVANTGGAPSKLYLNEGGMLNPVAHWDTNNNDDSHAVAWGDMNGDGYLDLAIGNAGQNTKVYLNHQGELQTVAAWSSTDNFNARSIAWGDMDGDGDLDLMIGNFDQESKLYLNEGGMLQSAAAWRSSEGKNTQSIALGDIDGDGDLDLAFGYNSDRSGERVQNEIYLNQRAAHLRFNGTNAHPPGLAIDLESDPVLTFNGQPMTALAPANFYATAAIRESGLIPITYWLYHPAAEPMRGIRAYYSLDGTFSGPRAEWQVAKPTVATPMTDLATAPYPTQRATNTHLFTWDVFGSEFFGQSDNVVLRLEALPDFKPRPNSAPGQYQYPFVAAQTLPFRVRGTQVRVVDAAGSPIPDAIVYRIPASQPDQSERIGTVDGGLRTTAEGYLQGRGELSENDRLFALRPVTQFANYTLYHTSGTPTEYGLDDFTVTAGGIQTLTVSAEDPLLLFDLIVSLEWHEGEDTPFLDTLRRNLVESSRSLYDWSNGQVALGNIMINQGREAWEDAHIQLLASNQVRPSANRGGVVTDTVILTDPRFTEPITATRGIIRIGPEWTRYGDSDPSYIYDWPRVLAHELGHYLLFLEDTYLGLDEESGLLIPISSCTNSAMTDPYESEGSEFRYADGRWQAECGQTLGELPDWELIRLVYPALQSPPPVNLGPATMPYALTSVTVQPPPIRGTALANQQLSLGDATSQLLNGRVYLRHANQQLIDLGKYTGQELFARGAQEGDELCIFAITLYACSELRNNQRTTFAVKPLWSPTIGVTPTSTTTLAIFVDQAAGTQVTAIIYPNGAHPQPVTIATGQVQEIVLNRPTTEALIDIRGTAANQRLITGYALGSGPGRLRSFDGPGRLRSFDGPVSSSDGGAVLYPPLQLSSDAFISLQLATTLPDLPLGLVPIGRAYYVRPSEGITDYTGGSIAFQYLGRAVQQAHLPEENLAVYRWTGAAWQCVQCTQQIRNLDQNIVSAPMVGPGLYMLAGYQVTLTGGEMNPVGYPLPYSLPVTQALAPLEDFYTVVYHYDVSTPSQPWHAFGVGAPDWVNRLQAFQPNQSYWLYVTQDLWWSIEDTTTAAATLTPEIPPAIIYGIVVPSAEFVPTVDLPVAAHINGNLCGETRTQLVDGQIVYVIAVQAATPFGAEGCGAMGQAITFTIDEQAVDSDTNWDHTQIQQVDLTVVQPLSQGSPTSRIYLPLVAR